MGLEEAVEPWLIKLWDALNKSNATTEGTGAGGVEVQFLYGSQTGNATEICKNIAAEAPGKGFANVTCNSLNEVDLATVLAPGGACQILLATS